MNTLFILLNLGEKNKNSEGMPFSGNPRPSIKIAFSLREGR